MLLIALICSFLLFWSGSLFCYYLIIPKAWNFFLSYQQNIAGSEIRLEAKISEYLNLFVQIITSFGICFQLPIILCILTILGLTSSKFLKEKRRLFIVIIFIIAAIFTPPDVFSQIALAIPLILLYEFSILFCMLIEARKKNSC
jgi:sec-independent protein translocase protein TatC